MAIVAILTLTFLSTTRTIRLYLYTYLGLAEINPLIYQASTLNKDTTLEG